MKIIYSENRYVDRLVREWIGHDRLIIASDFDDTIKPFNFNSQEVCDDVVNTLIRAQELGCYLVINTASVESRHQMIRDYCDSIGLRVDSLNVNPVPLPFGHTGKVYANIYIDDRGGLEQTVNTLKETMILFQKNKSTINDKN